MLSHKNQWPMTEIMKKTSVPKKICYQLVKYCTCIKNKHKLYSLSLYYILKTWFIVFAKHTAEILPIRRKTLNQSINQPNKRKTSMAWSTSTKLIDRGTFIAI